MTPNPLEELTLERLRARTSMKWRARPADVLPLWVAEMDVKLAPTVADAIRRAVDIGDTGYPYGTGLAEAVSEFASRRWQWDDLEVGRTAIVPDVMLGVVEMLRLVTERGDAVIVNAPVYPPFYAFVSHDGRRVIEAPLGGDGRIDLDALEEAFSRARASAGPHGNVAYLLCNPHNPTGSVHSVDELRGVAERARRFGVRVVSDEIHGPLVLSGVAIHPVSQCRRRRGRVGPDVGHQGVESLRAEGGAGHRRPGGGGRSSAHARRGQPRPEPSGRHRPRRRIPHWLTIGSTRCSRGLDENRTLLGKLVAEQLPEVIYQRAAGHLPRVAGLPTARIRRRRRAKALRWCRDLAGPARWFLDHARVALSSGHVFGTGGAGHVRVNFATSQAILTEALSRMGRALQHRGPGCGSRRRVS